MAKTPDEATIDREHEENGHERAWAESLFTRGREAIANVPPIAGQARAALEVAQSQVDRLSDRGVVVVAAFTAGVGVGLFLAGAPRFVLALAAIPVAMTVRSAAQRGIDPATLVN